ncbi:MAG: HAD hydrolase-like protein [Phycisphaerales bacterium]|nr:HAD hydrolase-like protein [Phycisphaerales bacterium]
MSDAQGLILFDVDATLISTSRAGINAMRTVSAELFGPAVDIDSIEFAGKLDPLIIGDILALAGLDATLAAIASFHARYRAQLQILLRDPKIIATALPGVMDLLATLERHDCWTLGLLTGNYSDTGSLKLRACGIDPDRFPVRVWAEDARGLHGARLSRDELPAIGITRWHATNLPATDRRGPVVVIGDTPHDIRCAKVNDCRSIAVATGPYEVDALAAYAPDAALEDLSDVPAVLALLETWQSAPAISLAAPHSRGVRG